MEYRDITAKGIFGTDGELLYQVRQNGGGKYYIESVAPAKDSDIDNLFRELTQVKKEV